MAANCTEEEVDAFIQTYTCSAAGTLLPLVNEYTWSTILRSVVYILGLHWCALALFIVSDILVESIVKILSKSRKMPGQVKASESNDDPKQEKVWNDTIALLIFLTVIISAPDIILGILEALNTGSTASGTGLLNVVSSAAFITLLIPAISVLAVASPEVRTIKATKVFAVITVFGIFAYVWLAVIVVVISPHVIEIWEALMTLLFYPILVGLAYVADRYSRNTNDNSRAEQELGKS